MYASPSYAAFCYQIIAIPSLTSTREKLTQLVALSPSEGIFQGRQLDDLTSTAAVISNKFDLTYDKVSVLISKGDEHIGPICTKMDVLVSKLFENYTEATRSFDYEIEPASELLSVARVILISICRIFDEVNEYTLPGGESDY